MISIMSKTDSVARILALAGGNGGGGTTGTTNYLELANKPMINGVELVGNKTTEDLGIEVGVSEETLIQTIAQESAARQKQDELLQGEIETKIMPANIKAGEGVSIEQSGLDVTISATSSYNDLLDKPTINNIELKDNVSLDDLNLMDKEQVQSAINNVIDDNEPSLTKTYSSSKIESLSGIKVLTGTNEKPIIANDLSIGTYVISGVVQSSQSNTTNITVPKKLYSVDKTDLGAAICYENPKTSQQTYYEFSLEGNEAPTERVQIYVTTEYLSSATLDGGTWI